jgi:hypothetical protein
MRALERLARPARTAGVYMVDSSIVRAPNTRRGATKALGCQAIGRSARAGRARRCTPSSRRAAYRERGRHHARPMVRRLRPREALIEGARARRDRDGVGYDADRVIVT